MPDKPNYIEMGNPTAAEGAATWPTKIYDQRYGSYQCLNVPVGSTPSPTQFQQVPFNIKK